MCLKPCVLNSDIIDIRFTKIQSVTHFNFNTVLKYVL